MNATCLRNPLLWVGLLWGLVLLAALLFLPDALRDRLGQWQALEARCQDLRSLREQQARERAPLDAAERSGQTLAAEPAEWIPAYLPDLTFELLDPASRELGLGWRLRSLQVRIDTWSYPALKTLIEKAELQSPAWRIQALDLRSVPGGISGTLLMEALDKAPPPL